MAELEDGYTDPFSPENAAGLALITQMRIYDVLVAILNKLDPEVADLIYDAHEAGRIVSSLPSFTGLEEESVEEE